MHEVVPATVPWSTTEVQWLRQSIRTGAPQLARRLVGQSVCLNWVPEGRDNAIFGQPSGANLKARRGRVHSIVLGCIFSYEVPLLKEMYT